MARALTAEEIRSAENIFRGYLRDRRLKYTPERRSLLQEVLGNDGHFEAEQLLIALRQSPHRVAKATVYRTLPLLVNCGILRQVQFGDKLTRYEHTFGLSALPAHHRVQQFRDPGTARTHRRCAPLPRHLAPAPDHRPVRRMHPRLPCRQGSTQNLSMAQQSAR